MAKNRQLKLPALGFILVFFLLGCCAPKGIALAHRLPAELVHTSSTLPSHSRSLLQGAADLAKSLIDKVTGGGSSTPSTAGGVGLGTVQDAISGLTGKVSNATDLGGLAGKISNATDKLTGLKDQVAPANSTLGKVLDTIASGGSTYDTSGGAEGAAQRIMNRDPTHWETINGNQTGLGGDMLAKFTAQMIAGQAGVYRQTVRIPVKAFLERACQVVYLPAPTFHRYEVTVTAYPERPRAGTNTSDPCYETGKSSALDYFVFVDGHNTPPGLNGVSQVGQAPWGAIIENPESLTRNKLLDISEPPAGSRFVASLGEALLQDTRTAMLKEVGSAAKTIQDQATAAAGEAVPEPLKKASEAAAEAVALASSNKPPAQFTLEAMLIVVKLRAAQAEIAADPNIAATTKDSVAKALTDLRVISQDVMQQNRDRLTDIGLQAFDQGVGKTFSFVDEATYEQLRKALAGMQALADQLNGRAGFSAGVPGPNNDLRNLRSQTLADQHPYTFQGSVNAQGFPNKVDVMLDTMPVFSAYDLECVDLTKAARLAANYREPASVVQAMNDTDKAKATAESRASRQKKLWEKLDSLDAEDSCFSSQVVVYMYYDATQCASPSQTWPQHGSTPMERALNMSLASDMDAGGYVEVSITFSPYSRCVDHTTEKVVEVSQMLSIAVSVMLGAVMVVLVAPSAYRALFVYPLMLVSGKLRDKMTRDANSRAPLARAPSGTYKEFVTPFRSTGGGPGLLSCCLGPVFLLRKHLLYAVSTVRYPDGQSRTLQVALMSCAATAILLLSNPPRKGHPLNIFVPELALAVPMRNDYLSKISFFAFVVVYSAFMGTLAYMAMIANFNSPTNGYYLLQSCISGLCTLVLNVLLLLQVGNLLGQFENLEPKWPYLPMVIFQLACVAVVDFMQVKILIRKEDLRERAVRERFAAYQQQMRERADKLSAQSSAPGKGHSTNQLLPSNTKRSSDVAVTVLSEPAVAIGGLATRRSRGSRDAATNSETEGEARGGAGAAGAAAASGGGARTMKRTKSETPSDQEDAGSKGGRAAAGGPLRVLAKVWTAPTARLRHALAETADFKYPSWFLAAVLVSCVLLVSYYIKAMFWSGKVADCVVDPTGCMHATIGRFFRSADDLTEKWVQRRLYNALETLIEQKPRVDGLFDTAEGLTAQLSSAADGLFAGNILARSATGQLALNTTDILQDLVRGMDNTVEGVFKVLGQTMVLVRNSVTIEGEVKYVVNTYYDLFAYTSVIGYTTGLLIALATVAQTAVAYRQAVRQAHRLRLTRRMFARTARAGRAAATASRPAPTSSSDEDPYRTVKNGKGGGGGGIPEDEQDATADGRFQLVHAREGGLGRMRSTRRTAADDWGAKSVGDRSSGFHSVMSNAFAKVTSFKKPAVTYNSVAVGEVEEQAHLYTAAPSAPPLPMSNLKNSPSRAAAAAAASPLPVSHAAGSHSHVGGSPAKKAVHFPTSTRAGSGSAGPHSSGRSNGLAASAADVDAVTAPRSAEEPQVATVVEPDGRVRYMPLTAHTLAEERSISYMVLFFGVLTSSTVIQMYTVGTVLSVLLAALLHPSFWEFMIGKPNNRPLMYVIIFFTVLLLKKVVILRYLAGSYLSDGHRVHHPAAWLAFQVILSITFLATGFLVVVWRLFFMVATTIFAIGKIDKTILALCSHLDTAHSSFLGGLHAHDALTNFKDKIYLPGARGAANRRWRRLRKVVLSHSPEEFRRLALSPGAAGEAVEMAHMRSPDDNGHDGDNGNNNNSNKNNFHNKNNKNNNDDSDDDNGGFRSAVGGGYSRGASLARGYGGASAAPRMGGIAEHEYDERASFRVGMPSSTAPQYGYPAPPPPPQYGHPAPAPYVPQPGVSPFVQQQQLMAAAGVAKNAASPAKDSGTPGRPPRPPPSH